MGNFKLSPNFTFYELTNSTQFPELVEANRIDANNIIHELACTASSLQSIREILKIPMIITSGYRSKELNKAVGGAANSSHLKGLAADFITSMPMTDVFEILKENKRKIVNCEKAILEKINGRAWIHITASTEFSISTKFFITTDGKNFKVV